VHKENSAPDKFRLTEKNKSGNPGGKNPGGKPLHSSKPAPGVTGGKKPGRSPAGNPHKPVQIKKHPKTDKR
jgi:hypothetical protein